MTKRLAIKVGEFTNQQGETKGEYVKAGVILDGSNGEYILLDPTVNIAGCLAKQNLMNHAAGKQVRDSVMCSVFTDQPQGQQQGGAPQQQQQQSQPNQQQQGASSNGFDDNIPF